MKILKAVSHFIFFDLICLLLSACCSAFIFILKLFFKVLLLTLKLSYKTVTSLLYILARFITWPFRNCFPPKSIDQMTGLEFEDFCTKWLSLEGHRNIRKTPVTSDYGVDIVTVKGNETIGIQCKRYSGNVGVGAIQEIVAGLQYYDCTKGYVITNSRFTANAISLAETNDITLIDGNYLNDSRSCKTLTQNIFNMKLSLVLMTFYILFTFILVILCLFLNFQFLPLAILAFTICTLSFVNGYLELKSRKKMDESPELTDTTNEA